MRYRETKKPAQMRSRDEWEEIPPRPPGRERFNGDDTGGRGGGAALPPATVRGPSGTRDGGPSGGVERYHASSGDRDGDLPFERTMGLPSRPQTRATIPSWLRSLRTFALVCAVLVLGSLVGFADPVPNAPPVAKPERQLLVKCAGGPSGEAAHAADTAVGATRVRAFHALGWHLVEIPDAVSVAVAMARYRGQPGVLAVEPNAVLSSEPPLPVGEANGESGMANRGEDSRTGSPPQERNPRLHSPFAIPDSPPPGVIPNDPRFNSQWNLKIIGMTNAWAVTTGSSNVVVALIETGIDYNHEDLRDNMWRNPGESGLDARGQDKASNGADDDANGYVDDVYGIDITDRDSDPFPGPLDSTFGHGTGVAGIVGARGNNGLGLTGINWSVRIMVLRADFRAASSPGAELAANALACMDYVLLMKRRGVNIRVINNSYNFSSRSRAMWEAVEGLGKEGILVVCSAGNDDRNADTNSSWPHGFDLPYVVSVAASTSTDALIEYSNFGRNTVDLAAPTVVLTTARGSRYTTGFEGTSAACPHVTGAAALLSAFNPDATALQLKAALLQSVDQKPAFRGKVVSSGRLNVVRALEVVTNLDLPPVVVGAFPSSSRSVPEDPIELWFNKAMDQASVEGALRIDPPVAGVYEWGDGGRVLRLRHTEPLARVRHTCRLFGSARDGSGASLDGNFNRVSEGSSGDDYVWEFGFGPSNDDFKNATPLSTLEGSIAGETRNADNEIYEPISTGFPYDSLTVWYVWTAPKREWMTFEASPVGSTDLAIAAYAGGAMEDLIPLAYNDDDGPRRQPRISWMADEGQKCAIVVAGKFPLRSGDVEAASGPFTLKWYPTGPPRIVSLAPTSASVGTTVTLNGTNFTGVTRVLFNGVEAQFTTLTNTHNFYDRRLAAVVPANATTGPITLETPHGNGTSTDNFEVLEGPPTLLAALEPNRVLVLTWPSSATGFVLESSPAFGPSAWAPVGLPIETPASRNSVRVQLDGLSRFYRLRRP